VRIGLFTDSLEHLSLEEVLDWLETEVPLIQDLEIGTGGYSPVPHCELPSLLADAAVRTRWLQSMTRRGFRLSALNVSGNPLELQSHDTALRETIELAGLLGVDRVVCMSGGDASLSAGGWFPEIDERREAYWRDIVAPYWEAVSEAAARHGPLRLCLELEPGAAVYNVATFERLAAVAPNVAVNLDPSHLFWQSMDPLVIVRRLSPHIGFVHGKDTVLNDEKVVLDGVLDRRAWRFATVGDGHDSRWWRSFVDVLQDAGYDGVISVEYEDPTERPQRSVARGAAVLAEALAPG
jgi:sugar phosphate isomerase/epimerase